MGIADDLINNLNGNNNSAGNSIDDNLPWENEAKVKSENTGQKLRSAGANGVSKFLNKIDLSSNKTKLAIGIVALLLFVGGYSIFNLVNSQKGVKVESSSAEETKTTAEITVHIGGAVKNPGVYKLTSTQRLMDAVNMAGGLTENADSDQVNLAKILEDGEQIIIPSKTSAQSGSASGDSTSSGDSGNSSSAGSSSSQSGKVNINTADLTTLQTLSGVGPSTAQKIIDYRNAHGKFKTIEEIKNVSGIGDKTYAKFADKICV